MGQEIDPDLAAALNAKIGENGWHSFQDTAGNIKGFHVGDTSGAEGAFNEVLTPFLGKMHGVTDTLLRRGVELAGTVDNPLRYRPVTTTVMGEGDYDGFIARGKSAAEGNSQGSYGVGRQAAIGGEPGMGDEVHSGASPRAGAGDGASLDQTGPADEWLTVPPGRLSSAPPASLAGGSNFPHEEDGQRLLYAVGGKIDPASLDYMRSLGAFIGTDGTIMDAGRTHEETAKAVLNKLGLAVGENPIVVPTRVGVNR